ncbi:PcfJ domain-containing protein [Enterococcus casseliflavus]|nr:PcfJ domain-containing protein [Enterococcus casseliflavus]
MGVDDISKIPEGVKPITFQNYLMKQKRTIGFYQDYLNMLNELGLPITPMTRLPKDLKMAHDKAVATLNAMKREIVRKEFEKRAIEEDFLEMTIKDVQFILPKEANDLIEEGKSLKHYVGGRSYINQHAEGETTIVFARKTTEPDKPYYTIEYCDSRLVQVHGFKNKRPDEQLREIVNQWLYIVNKRYKTEEKKHVA